MANNRIVDIRAVLLTAPYGVPGAQTAAFHDAYLADPAYPHGHRGELLVDLPEMVRMVDKSERSGMGLKVHCAGDRAVTQMLDAVEAVRHFRGPTTVRHHIAHASYIKPEDIKRFAELTMDADVHHRRQEDDGGDGDPEFGLEEHLHG